MVTSTDVIAAFPELSAVGAGTWTWAIGQAYRDLNPCEFDVDLDSVALVLAAHYGALFSGKANGIVSEEHVGTVGRSYQMLTGLKPNDLSMSRYGLMVRRMIENKVHRWLVG